MEDNEARLIKLNPENGWGDFDSALNFVSLLILSAIRNPNEVWEGD